MEEAQTIWAYVGRLCYTLHGGSGYTFTRTDVLNMTPEEAEYHLLRQKEWREQEARILRGKR